MSDLKLFIRNLWRNKLYSFVSVFGFAMALMFVILLTAYIRQELAVDEFHANKDRIYRAVTERASNFGALVGGQLKNKCPEIECYSRVYQRYGLMENENREKVSYRGLMVDSSFFRMFSFPVLAGNPGEAFHAKRSVVITRSWALKVFGEDTEAVVGKTLNLDGRRLIVTGVLEDLPDNTHINKADLFLPFDDLGVLDSPETVETNNNTSFGLYVMTYPGADLVSKEQTILNDFKKDYWLYMKGYAKEFHFEPLTSVYWGGKGGSATHSNNKTYIFILTAIVLTILLLALINYNNLSMARVGFRAKEAAVKKLVGITDRALFFQIVAESVFLCFIAFALAGGLAYLVKPLFNEVLETNIKLSGQLTWGSGMVVLFAVVALGFLSGAVPAAMIIRFNPVEVVKGAFRRKTRGTYGKALICFQYTVSMVLVICTLVIIRQTDYLRNYELGFDKENIIWLGSEISGSQKEALRNEFLKIPGVQRVSFVTGSPITGISKNAFDYRDRSLTFGVFKVDSSFFNMLNIRVRPTAVAKSSDGVFLNEAAVKELEIGDLPVEFRYWDQNVPVLGVMNDFHFERLMEKVGPLMIMEIGDDDPLQILVQVDGQSATETSGKVKEAYAKFINGKPYDSGFMKDTIDQWYGPDERQARLVGYFAVVSVILAMMGILAMATYYISQRVKEVGVRRVNGATVQEVLGVLVMSFMRWVGVAFVLACPIAWYAMNRWLEGYPFRVDMGWWVFALVGIGISVIALSMVGWQSVKAANTNPVNSLKSE